MNFVGKSGVKGIVFALISSSTFGLIPFFAIPIIKSGMGNQSIILYRFGLAALMMLLIVLFQRKSLKVERSQVLPIIVAGVLYAATSLGLLMSYSYIPSGTATTIHFLYPIVVTLIMAFVYKENRSAGIFVAAALSLFGVTLLCWNGGGVADLRGVLLALGTVVTYAAYIVYLNKSGVGLIDTIVLTFYVLGVGAVIFLLYALATTGIEPIPDFKVGFDVVFLALIPTVISDWTLVLAVKYAGSTITSILGSMEPLTAVVVGVICFAEPFGLISLIGLVLIMVSVLMVILGKKR